LAAAIMPGPAGQHTHILQQERATKKVTGAGIAGLTAALALKRAGHTVAVLEAARIGSGVTGHTTGAAALHAVSAICTHLGCTVEFNADDLTWDCTCHGSRFAADGAVIQGPAEKNLEALPSPPRPTRSAPG